MIKRLLLGLLLAVTIVPITASAAELTIISCPSPVLTLDLNRGPRTRDRDTNGEVSSLQAFLWQYKTLQPTWNFPKNREDFVSGNFGSRTEDIVKNFQKTFMEMTVGSPGYGKVGPATREKILTLCNSMRVLSPNGGESWQLGNTHSILWAPYNPTMGVNPASQVSAYLEKMVNGSYVRIGKIIECGRASIHWDGALDMCGNGGKLAEPGQYYLYLVNDQTGQWDRSDGPFILVAKDFLKADLKINGSDADIVVPENGGTYTASWTSNTEKCALFNDTIPYTDPEYMKANLASSGSTSVKLLANTAWYAKSISLNCTSQAPIEGSAYDKITILPINQSLRIITPNGLEILDRTSQHLIQWSVPSNITKVSVALYKNDASYAWIVKDLPTSNSFGYYNWSLADTIPAQDVGNNVFKIYILGYKSDGGTLEDKSDVPFSIASNSDITFPSVSIVRPSLGTNNSYATTTSPLGRIRLFATDNVAVQNVSWRNNQTNATGITQYLGNGTNYESPKFDLTPGTNSFTFTATDVSGLSATVTLTVSYMSPPTSVNLKIQGSDSTVVVQSRADLSASWSSQNADSCSFEVHAPTTGDRYVLANTPLSSAGILFNLPGQATSYTASLTCKSPTDAASDHISIIYSDTTLPVIQILVPTPNDTYATASNNVTLSALITDNSKKLATSTAQWKNNTSGASGMVIPTMYGWAAQNPSSGAFNVPLTSGSNTITYSITDMAGNTGYDTIVVTYTPPTASVRAPLAAIPTPPNREELGSNDLMASIYTSFISTATALGNFIGRF